MADMNVAAAPMANSERTKMSEDAKLAPEKAQVDSDGILDSIETAQSGEQKTN